MSAGCFSWCPQLRRWSANKSNMETEENQLAIVKVPEPVPVREFFMEPESDQKEKTRSVVPTTTEYVIATGKQALTLLQSAASIIPVPLLKEAIGIALKIIEVCKEVSAVQQKVKELQDRVSHLMVVIVDNVTVRYEEGIEVVVKAAEGIQKDLEDLLSTLKTIDKELTELRKQNEWLQGLYTDLNVDAIESCLVRLSIAQEKFKLANDLRDSNLLLELHTRLNGISTKIDDVHKDVKHVADTVENISTYLFKSKRSATDRSSDTVVRHQIPLKPEVFHGRDDLVEEIAQLLLNKETAHICLLGPGGMGKTSVSLAVVELPLIQEVFPGGNCAWVPCVEATSAALLLEILYDQLKVPGDKQVTLEKVISELNTSKQPRLILLDNFETPWNAPGAGSQKQIEDILRQLAELSHIAIFVTMRGTNPPCNNAIQWQSKNIKPTDEQACLRIYHDINPSSKDDPDVKDLLEVLGHMPFAVTLMAKLGMEGESTAKELLDAWRESGPDILSDKPEESMNRSISLSVESDPVRRNPLAIILLAILSLLPAGTTRENLHDWWTLDSGLKKSMIPSAVATLSKAALLVKNKRENSDSPVLSVIPVVQSFMQQRGRIEEKTRKRIQLSCCHFVLDHACRYDEPAFPVKSKALAAEATNIQSILFGSPWHRCDTKPDLEIANYVVKAARASGVQKYIVSAVWCLGRTYRQLGDHLSSYIHEKEAYMLSDVPPSEAEVQRLHCQCGVDLVEVARMSLEDTSEAVSLARDVEMKCAALSDDHIHGRSLVRLGAALDAIKQRQEALVHLNRARIMLAAVKNTSNLAGACQIIARVHFNERRLPEALEASREAWRLTEDSPSPSSQAIISLEAAKIHFSANRDAEAWKYAEIALLKASQIGHRLAMARALELMGYGYLRRGDYENANGAYEAAAENFHGTVQANVEARCKDNVARIKKKQRNPDAKVSFHRPGTDADKSPFYPNVPSVNGDMPC